LRQQAVRCYSLGALSVPVSAPSGGAAGTGADARDVRMVMDFEAPTGSAVAWLNSGTYVARRVQDAAANTMSLRVYDVSGVTTAANGPGDPHHEASRCSLAALGLPEGRAVGEAGEPAVLNGGADYQNLSNEATIDARYLWQTADGEIIIAPS
jgi:hypothetical protein